MSLDIYLTSATEEISDCQCDCCGNNHQKKCFPIIERFNLTHNLTSMAVESGVYTCVWRPEELDITKASEMIVFLKYGIDKLKSDPQKFMKYNPSNGFGSYENLLDTLVNYLLACEQNPTATISVSR